MDSGLTISALPDAVLGSILSRLEPRERVGVEAVSRRWHAASRQYAWSEQIHLDRTTFWEDGEGIPLVNKAIIVNRRLKCLLDRCCAYLREVDFDVFVGNYLDASIISHIAAAGNLTTLVLTEFPLTYADAASIGQRLSKLERLELPECLNHMERSETETALTCILEGCRSLQQLDVSDNESLTGATSFSHFPPTLRSLNIWGCTQLHPSVIDHLRSACADGQLRELNVTYLPIDSPVMAMGRLFEELPALEKLVYTHGWLGGAATPQETNTAMAKICYMRGLKSLDLSYNRLTNKEVLEELVRGCDTLEELVLSELDGAEPNNNLTPAALRLIGQLSRLTSLTLGNMHQLNDETLLHVVSRVRLHKLGLAECAFVSDTTISRVLERCGQLRELDIEACQGVTRAAVKEIGEFAARIAAEPVPTSAANQYFHLRCVHSSIEALPGELVAELKAVHPGLKSISQTDTRYGEESTPSSLHIQW